MFPWWLRLGHLSETIKQTGMFLIAINSLFIACTCHCPFSTMLKADHFKTAQLIKKTVMVEPLRQNPGYLENLEK